MSLCDEQSTRAIYLYIKLINFQLCFRIRNNNSIRSKKRIVARGGGGGGEGEILWSVISVKQPVDDYGNTTRVTTIDAYTGLDEISSRYGCTLIECQIWEKGQELWLLMTPTSAQCFVDRFIGHCLPPCACHFFRRPPRNPPAFRGGYTTASRLYNLTYTERT